MKEALVISKTDLGSYKVCYSNGVYLGDCLQKEDGFYDFWPDLNKEGCHWPEHLLRDLADLLYSLNKEWENTLANG